MRFIVVELESGEQEFFESAYDGFKYAKEHEDKQRNSVCYVAIGTFYEPNDGVIYRGQRLRNTLRMLNDVRAGLKVQVDDENVYAMNSGEDIGDLDESTDS